MKRKDLIKDPILRTERQGRRMYVTKRKTEKDRSRDGGIMGRSILGLGILLERVALFYVMGFLTGGAALFQSWLVILAWFCWETRNEGVRRRSHNSGAGG
jgi:hypothetical protein